MGIPTQITELSSSTTTITTTHPQIPDLQTTESQTLPPNGDTYTTKIYTRTLGVVLFPPQKLTGSLFSLVPPAVLRPLRSRPVISYLIENSPAQSAAIELGDVLLSVNGKDTPTIREALRALVTTPRPLELKFYVLPEEVKIVVGEGTHAVNYDGKGGRYHAPSAARDWKKKYVVVGGVIAKPWVMSFYRSKAEYDIAVIETQSHRPLSVKVKQFSLREAIIESDARGPQVVTYPQAFPWKYIIVVMRSGLPIKISSAHLADLKAVHEAIRRVLADLEKERERELSRGDEMVNRVRRILRWQY